MRGLGLFAAGSCDSPIGWPLVLIIEKYEMAPKYSIFLKNNTTSALSGPYLPIQAFYFP
jgi:hypothetical protein